MNTRSLNSSLRVHIRLALRPVQFHFNGLDSRWTSKRDRSKSPFVGVVLLNSRVFSQNCQHLRRLSPAIPPVFSTSQPGSADQSNVDKGTGVPTTSRSFDNIQNIRLIHCIPANSAYSPRCCSSCCILLQPPSATCQPPPRQPPPSHQPH